MLPVTGTVSQAAVAGHRVDERPGRGEQVRAVVHPVVAARVRAQPAAEPVLGLQQQHVTVAQPPRRRQPGDASADRPRTSRVAHGGHDPRAAVIQARVDYLAESKAELLSLQQVRCFCAALELGSFSAAAEALRVSQPAVAEQIRKLERALGADLFVRAGRGVVPTDAGHAFAEHAARSLRALEDAAGSVGEFTAMRSGGVALGTFSAPSTWRLEEVVAAFLRAPPEHDRPAV